MLSGWWSGWGKVDDYDLVHGGCVDKETGGGKKGEAGIWRDVEEREGKQR